MFFLQFQYNVLVKPSFKTKEIILAILQQNLDDNLFDNLFDNFEVLLYTYGKVSVHQNYSLFNFLLILAVFNILRNSKHSCI